MGEKSLHLTLTVALLLLTAGQALAKHHAKRTAEADTTKGAAVLWRNPADIKSRNLFYGPGGKLHTPPPTVSFEKEDVEGTSPKFNVRDEDGVRWKAKMGYEARPETVASRLVWAVGYFTNEDYFVADLHVQSMPAHLHRGQQFVAADGTAHNVRLKRYLEDEKKIGIWRWQDNPLKNTRQLNGLRVMMALINNWDLKDSNNAVYHKDHFDGFQDAANVYLVSDLGASFGTTGFGWTQPISKGNLSSYQHSNFISKIAPEYVSFSVPSRSAIIHIFDPPEYLLRLRLRSIGKQIPRDDVHWMGQMLAQLSPEQISDAFRAAGYSPEETEAFSEVVKERIAELAKI